MPSRDTVLLDSLFTRIYLDCVKAYLTQTSMSVCKPILLVTRLCSRSPRFCLFLLAFVISFAVSTGYAGNVPVSKPGRSNQTQTIIIIRHGEKPEDGLGQLSVTGLKRSLLLPGFFKANFPTPDYIFASNPNVKHYENHGDKKAHYYIRPLLTIAPTAITLGLPVNTGIGLDAPDELIRTLLAPEYHSSTIIVAWEHAQIVDIATKLISHFGADAVVPEWNNENYNMFFVFTIDRRKTENQLRFSVRSEDFPDLHSIPVCPPYLDALDE